MSSRVYIDPYTPNLVPQTNPNNDQGIAELQRFLSDELERIAISIRGSSVQAAYAALGINAPQTELVGITPTRYEDFTFISPQRPQRITSNPPDFYQLIPEEQGVYYISAFLTALIDSGRAYTLTVYINGVAADIFAAVDASNQTDFITLSFAGIIELKRGDVVELWISSNLNNSQFDCDNGFFSLHRISEIHDVIG